jgi:hypothetical protein
MGTHGRLAAIACALWLACAAVSGTAAEQGTDTPQPPRNAQPQHLDSIARLLAGLRPSRADYETIARTEEWQTHSKAILSAWAPARDGQLSAMLRWRRTELPQKCPTGDTLFYPFSGPDFINAYVLFPYCNTFILFGLEEIGALPDPLALSPPELTAMLKDVRQAMVNLFERNYFVTTTMKKDLTTEQLHGVLPVLMISMVLAGVEVVSVGPAPFPHHAGKKHDLDGVNIEFRAPGFKETRHVIYYSLDASDKGLRDYPEFLTYLRKLNPTTTLLKSASYLLHIDAFVKMRNVILGNTTFLIQDDTGVPYDILVKRGWTMQAYGSYGMPITPFESKFQQPLADLYNSGQVRALPFRFGYQRNKGQNYSSLIIAQRSAAAPPPNKRDAR